MFRGPTHTTAGVFRHFDKPDLSDHVKTRLRTECEAIKRKLSSLEEVPVDLGESYERCTRTDFEKACRDILERPISLITQLFSGAEVEEADVDGVVLVGGSTRIPFIQEALSERFGARRLNHTVNPDEAVARGAAIHAKTLEAGKKTLLLLDVQYVSWDRG